MGFGRIRLNRTIPYNSIGYFLLRYRESFDALCKSLDFLSIEQRVSAKESTRIRPQKTTYAECKYTHILRIRLFLQEAWR